MSDWRAELERERHTTLTPPRPDATFDGPSATYAEWVESRVCGDKRGFSHQLKARQAILLIARDGGPDMAEYRCQYCTCWHLTTQVEEASSGGK